MKITLEQLRTLVEGGDQAALESYIKSGLEKSDMPSVLDTNKEIKSYFDAEKDTHHNKALETWKSNHLQGLIDEELKKANPELTDEQKRIAALEKEIAETKSAAIRDKLTAEYTKLATNDKIPVGLLDLVIGADEESTKANYSKLAETYNKALQVAVEEKFKAGGRNPGAGSGGKDDEGAFGKELAAGKTDTKTIVEAQQNYFG